MRNALSFRIELEPDPLALGKWCYDGRPGPDFPHGVTLIGRGHADPHAARISAYEKAKLLAGMWVRQSNATRLENQKYRDGLQARHT